MTPRTPPRAATWLAERLITRPNREALLGDLVEEYQNRSAGWYWRQVIGAIALHLASTMNRNRGPIARWLLMLPLMAFGIAELHGLMRELEELILIPFVSISDLHWKLQSANAVVLGFLFVLVAPRIVSTHKTAAAIVAFAVAFAWGLYLVRLSLPDVNWFVWGFVTAIALCIGSVLGLVRFWIGHRSPPTFRVRLHITQWRTLWAILSSALAIYLTVALVPRPADVTARNAAWVFQLWLLPTMITYAGLWLLARMLGELSNVDLRRALTKWRSHC